MSWQAADLLKQQISFLVDHNKNLFYCYGSGGGDVIRFVALPRPSMHL